MTLNLAFAYVIFLGGIFFCMLLTTISTEDRRKRAVYTSIPPSDSYDETHDWMSDACPIASVHLQSFDHLAFRVILSHYVATLAFSVQQLHKDARPVINFSVMFSKLLFDITLRFDIASCLSV